MHITILHNPMSFASRDFLAVLGVAIPAGDDVTVTIGSDTVRIVSDHAAAVAFCPAFPGYPVALTDEGEARRMLAFPATWEAVTTWAANPPTVAPTSLPRFTPAEFMRLLTQDELDAVLLAEGTDIDVRRMWAFIRAVGYVDMADPLTQQSLHMLRAKGFIAADERLQQIEDGVFQV